MIIRETKIIECWCPKCHCGQVQQILQKSFEEKKPLQAYVGQKFTCENCGKENEVEDFLSVIPESFLVFSQSDISKMKSNKELKNFLDKE